MTTSTSRFSPHEPAWLSSFAAGAAWVLGFLAPGAAVVGGGLLLASDGGTRITGAEWVAAGVAVVITSGGFDVLVRQRVNGVAREAAEAREQLRSDLTADEAPPARR